MWKCLFCSPMEHFTQCRKSKWMWLWLIETQGSLYSPWGQEKTKRRLRKNEIWWLSFVLGMFWNAASRKITYFGICCEVLNQSSPYLCSTFFANWSVWLKQVEGVTALIHQSEVSWDATLDHASCFKMGQVEWVIPLFCFNLQKWYHPIDLNSKCTRITYDF